MSENGTRKVKLATRGMTCTSCSMLIEMKLTKLDGVLEASSDYAKEETVVVYDPTKVDLQKIIAVVEDEGYDAAEIG